MQTDLRSLFAFVAIVFPILWQSAAAEVNPEGVAVKSYETDWSFSDDFESGVLQDGGAGEALHYVSVCGGESGGGHTDADVHDGALHLVGPDSGPPCSGDSGWGGSGVSGAFVAPYGGSVRAIYRFEVPGPNQQFGLDALHFDSELQVVDDAIQLRVVRSTVPEPSDTLMILQFDEDEYVHRRVILAAGDPESFVGGAAIELKLDLVPDASGQVIVGNGSYRFCELSDCSDDEPPPFQVLPEVNPPASSTHIARDHPVGFSLAAAGLLTGSPFSFGVEGWSASATARDDFTDGLLGARVPIAVYCGDVTDANETDGALVLGHDESCERGAQIVGFFGGLPGELVTRAEFRFLVPEVACDVYGMSASQNPAIAGPDFASILVTRRPDLGDPAAATDALQVLLMSEAESSEKSLPVMARKTISLEPDSDPALADVESIELELTVAEYGGEGARVPTGRYRLCTAAGCSGAFMDLDAHSQSEASAESICGADLAAYDPPADGLGLLGPEFLGTALFADVRQFVPEGVEVETYEADWSFADDFESAVLQDGGAGEGLHYASNCGGESGGGHTDADVHDGALHLVGPDPGEDCGGGSEWGGAGVSGYFDVRFGGSARVIYRFEVPGPNQNYGLDAVHFDQELQEVDDAIRLRVVRSTLLGQSDTLLILQSDEEGKSHRGEFLALEDPESFEGGAAIELMLELEPDASGQLMVGTGSYRFCETPDCTDFEQPVFKILPEQSPAGPSTHIAMGNSPGFVLGASGKYASGPFGFWVEEWRASQYAQDDFEDGVLGADDSLAVYCGDLSDESERDGALILRRDDACEGGSVLVGFPAGQPGELLTSASFRFLVPEVSCDRYGVVAGQDPAIAGPDSAMVAVLRGPDLVDPSGFPDTLQVLLVSESEGAEKPTPVVARKTISTDPAADAALVDIEHIELELRVAEHGDEGARIPTGHYRLCTAEGCAGDFTDLDPHSPASGGPGESICGFDATAYDPPEDGLGLLGPESLGTTLVSNVPEPASALLGGGALGILAALAGGRRPRG